MGATIIARDEKQVPVALKYLREGLDRRDVDFSQDDALLAAART